jgi:hypothetical protein
VPRLDRDGEGFLINLVETENHFTADSVSEIDAAEGAVDALTS